MDASMADAVQELQPAAEVCPIKTCQRFDAGAAQSGHSDHTTQQAVPAASDTALQRADQPNSPESVVTAAPASPVAVQLPALTPLPPPDASEGPEAAAEYEVYLQRWDEGDTLAQRWHRLAQKGKVEGIEAEYEDWQLDVILQQVRARTHATQAAHTQQRPGAVTPGTGAGSSSRLRRGRVEFEEAAAAAGDCQVDGGPRKVRSRRAPSTLQDYHVENRRTPDRQDTGAAAAAAAGGISSIAGRQQQQQQQQPAVPTNQQQQQQAAQLVQPQSLLQQQQQMFSHLGLRLQRPLPATALQQQMQQQQQHWQMGRMSMPYNPILLQQQQAQAQAQAQARLQQQQHQAQLLQARAQQQQRQQQQQMMQQLLQQMQQQGMPSQHQQQQQEGQAQVPPEVTEQWYKIGTTLGSLMQERGGPANLLQNPQAMCALVGTVLKQATGDADVTMQQLVATMHGAGAGNV